VDEEKASGGERADELEAREVGIVEDKEEEEKDVDGRPGEDVVILGSESPKDSHMFPEIALSTQTCTRRENLPDDDVKQAANLLRQRQRRKSRSDRWGLQRRRRTSHRRSCPASLSRSMKYTRRPQSHFKHKFRSASIVLSEDRPKASASGHQLPSSPDTPSRTSTKNPSVSVKAVKISAPSKHTQGAVSGSSRL
ncbi:hypothetical protein GBAR_LOCUS17215, partial [Geodia barretti]